MATRVFTGTTDPKEQTYEIQNKEVSKIAAKEGFVLLENKDGVLPLKKDSKVALYGAGAINTIKGGTGSGDVNSRNTVSIYDGLRNAGFEITTKEWMESFQKEYDQKRQIWKDEIWKKVDRGNGKEGTSLFDVYVTTPFITPAGDMPTKTDTDTAIYVLSRNAGEGADRFEEKGDYYLTEEENTVLEALNDLYENVVFIMNTGGLIDLSFLDRLNHIKSVLYISQPGMEAGNALSDILIGKDAPSGKLTDTIPFSYSDYPNAKTFSHNNNNVQKEYYEEDIYVGYRYFDSFFVPVRYSFGYGLSYTKFQMKFLDIAMEQLHTQEPMVKVDVEVTNIGDTYAGKEVVQIYACPPQNEMVKEYRRLVGFGKTKLLQPKESQIVTVTIPVYALASFYESTATYALEAGNYGIFIGNSLMSSTFEATVVVDEMISLIKTMHICPLKEELNVIKPNVEILQKERMGWEALVRQTPFVTLCAKEVTTKEIQYDFKEQGFDKDIQEKLDSLTTEELINLATGEIAWEATGNLGAAGSSVPGAAAQTSRIALDRGIDYLVLADGPAGVRLMKEYCVEEDEILPQPFENALENGFLTREESNTKGTKMYQYCTAMPVGTLLAQTWNTNMIEEVGDAVAKEMQRFHVQLWLAPGMNIHRNPLCGRNFEYYSEDPLLTGHIAAAMTKGVQKNKGCGVTIKHYACNNQEDNRLHSDSVLTERALRELYLKGFELAVKKAHPLSIMTSYNLINGVHAANNEHICTNAARDEWGFDGAIMTDWTTTMHGDDCTASGCMRAGNDMIMPGAGTDHANMEKELKEHTLELSDLKRCIGNLLNITKVLKGE